MQYSFNCIYYGYYRELLDVLQQQMENAHAIKLELIVIYLIIVEVVLQVFAILNNKS